MLNPAEGWGKPFDTGGGGTNGRTETKGNREKFCLDFQYKEINKRTLLFIGHIQQQRRHHCMHAWFVSGRTQSDPVIGRWISELDKSLMTFKKSGLVMNPNKLARIIDSLFVYLLILSNTRYHSDQIIIYLYMIHGA